MKRKQSIEKQKKIAKERINLLFSKADQSSKKLADRYVTMARKIAMKLNLRLSSHLKRKFCKHCGCYLIPGKNLRVRTRNGKLVYYCSECRKFWRKPCK